MGMHPLQYSFEDVDVNLFSGSDLFVLSRLDKTPSGKNRKSKALIPITYLR